MRLLGTIGTLVGVLALAPVSAGAAPLILRCEGVVANVSAYEASSRTTAARFYRVDQGQFSRLDDVKVFWPANYCTTKGASCSTDDDAFTAKWRDGRAVVSVQINRKSGRVVEEREYGSGLETFVGACDPAPDPAQAGGPNRF